mmetsp:Transcript_15366/g.28982  ORF Transcript_15366/g.28982 Transcript_15366/m.28982 type:complete len:286 (+) Transcript_15366:44-901(+)
MVSSEAWRWQKHTWIAAMFSFVSGYADCICLVRYRAFATMLTGNAVMLARAIVNPDRDVVHHSGLYYVFIGLSFTSGALFHRLGEHAFPNRGGSIVAIPLAAGWLIAEIIYSTNDLPGEDVFYRDWSVVGVAQMFGVVASACFTGRMGTHTTMVTGHMLSMASYTSNLMVNRSLTTLECRKAFLSLMIIAGTLAGALFGAFLLLMVKDNVLLFPVPVMLYCLLWLHDHLAKPRSIIKKVQKKLRERSADDAACSVARPAEACTSTSDAAHSAESDEEDSGCEAEC